MWFLKISGRKTTVDAIIMLLLWC